MPRLREQRASSHRGDAGRRRVLVPTLLIAYTLGFIAAVLWLRPGNPEEPVASPAGEDPAAPAAALDDTGPGGPYGPAPTELAAPDLSGMEGRDSETAQRGIRLGAMSTPSFLVGGRPIVGAQVTEVFVQVVDDALAETG